jgi:hypothetical protein
MPLTHKLIASTTIGGSTTSSLTFSSIPSTYDHLYVKVSMRTNRNNDGYADVSFYFNGDQGNNYKTGALQGTGNTSVGNIGINGAVSGNGPFLMQSVPTGTTGYQYYFSNGDIFIPNYRANAIKVGRWESYAPWNTAGIHRLGSVTWSNTSAITSITFRDDNSATFQQYSTFQLYGLVNS